MVPGEPPARRGPLGSLGRGRVQLVGWREVLHYEFGPSQWLIGRDDGSREYGVLYRDDWEFSRVDGMGFKSGVWRIWRDAPGFHPRFDGRFRNRGRTIRAFWERSLGGKRLIHDLDLTYMRSR
jgi:hypothetical protein